MNQKLSDDISTLTRLQRTVLSMLGSNRLDSNAVSCLGVVLSNKIREILDD